MIFTSSFAGKNSLKNANPMIIILRRLLNLTKDSKVLSNLQDSRLKGSRAAQGLDPRRSLKGNTIRIWEPNSLNFQTQPQ